MNNNPTHRERSPDADKFTSMCAIIIFVIALIVFPLLISLGKSSSYDDSYAYTYPTSNSSNLKFD